MLSGVRVLDLTDESGWLAGKILGDLGADVVKVEPPGGDREGRRPPYLAGVPDPERSLVWLALNTSKRGVTLDLARPQGRTVLGRLLAWSDVVLETSAPGALEARGLAWESVSREHPRLVWCSLTPFGRSGPHASFRGRDLVVVALGGNAALTGDPDRPPVRCTLPTAYYHAAPEAALGVLMALEARQATGRGQLVDVSLHECQLQTLLGAPGIHARAGPPAREVGWPRRSGARTGRTREIWEARDGHVSFGLRGGPARVPGLRALVAWMDECRMAPDWLRAFDWERFRPESLAADEIGRLEAAFGAFFASRTRRELYDGALARRILLAPCNDAGEVLAHPQLRARGLFTTLEYPELGAAIEHPAFFGRSSTRPIGVRRRAPRIGEHNEEVYQAAGIDAREREKLAAEGVL
jgi:crotonobetainyl-CoA:carnitine CoA-transferase CaiB-like acyl-CoA transferase